MQAADFLRDASTVADIDEALALRVWRVMDLVRSVHSALTTVTPRAGPSGMHTSDGSGTGRCGDC